MMYQRVNLATSLMRDEVDEIDTIGVIIGNRRFRRAGTLRAMLRYTLHNRDHFIEWMAATEGKPVAGGE